MDPLKRSQIVATAVLGLAMVGLLGLLGRVAYIQKHVTPDDLDKLARQHDAKLTIMPNVGAIMARDGTALAVSVRMYNLFADPAFVIDPGGEVKQLRDKLGALEEAIEIAKEPDKSRLQQQLDTIQKQLDDKVGYATEARKTLAEALAPLLEMTPDKVEGLFDQNSAYANGHPRRFLWLQKEVDEAFYQRFMDKKKELRDTAKGELASIKGEKDPKKRDETRDHARVLVHAMDGVGFIKSIKRKYPMGQMAGQVIGFRNVYEGVDGLEHQLDDLLKGRLGQVLAIKDAARKTVLVQDKGYKPAENGCNVWLTLDTVMQSIVEDELTAACTFHKAESGVAVILEPNTGRVLAMANWPPFDPSNYQAARPQDRRNKAFDPFEPGSIFKPFVAGWAIEKHIVTPSTVVDCHGGRYYDPTGRLVTDVHGYGALSVEDVLVKSSNVGMTIIGWKMGIPTLHEGVTTFGFGARTGIELPGDEKGILTPLARANKGTLTSMSFGYEVAATPIQLVRAYATYANGGYLVTPRIIHAVEIEPGVSKTWSELAGPPVQKQIVSRQTCDTMRNIMEGVFTRGTAKKAASSVYRLFGKTGTAHLAVRGAGHYTNQYNASFLAGGPMSGPRLVAVVTLHKPDPAEGHFGGTVAAPACSRMLERCLTYLQVPPDQVEQPKQVTPLARH